MIFTRSFGTARTLSAFRNPNEHRHHSIIIALIQSGGKCRRDSLLCCSDVGGKRSCELKTNMMQLAVTIERRQHAAHLCVEWVAGLAPLLPVVLPGHLAPNIAVCDNVYLIDLIISDESPPVRSAQRHRATPDVADVSQLGCKTARVLSRRSCCQRENQVIVRDSNDSGAMICTEGS